MLFSNAQIVESRDKIILDNVKGSDFDKLEKLTYIDSYEIEDEFNQSYASIKEIDTLFSTVVDTISVEMTGENKESIIIIEHKMGKNDGIQIR